MTTFAQRREAARAQEAIHEAMKDLDPQSMLVALLAHFDAHPYLDADLLEEFGNKCGRMADQKRRSAWLA